MKKKRRITILVTAAVIMSLCAPISLRAQEEPVRMGTEETEIPDKIVGAGEESQTVPEESDESNEQQPLQDTASWFEETLQGLLLMEEPLKVLEKADEKERELFLNRITVREHLEFTIVYKYLLLTAIAEDTSFSESMQSSDEMTEAASGKTGHIHFLRELLMKNKDTDPGQEDIEDIQWREEIEQEAFRIFREGMEEKAAANGEESAEYHDFQEYTEYLQTQTHVDIIGFADVLEKMQSENEPEATEAYEAALNRLDEIYSTKPEIAPKVQIICGIQDYDVKKKEPYLTVTISDQERVDVIKLLPQNLEVLLEEESDINEKETDKKETDQEDTDKKDTDKIEKDKKDTGQEEILKDAASEDKDPKETEPSEKTVNVTWECAEDIEHTEYEQYTYTAVPQEGYEWSEELLKGEEDGLQALPYARVIIKPKETANVMAARAAASVSYRAYCQNDGWKSWSAGSATAGTIGENKRLEALQIKMSGDTNLGVKYQVHVQNNGWMSWVNGSGTAGTTGQSLRVEAVRVLLTGASAGSYDIYYRIYCESYGWLDWAKNGQAAGTVNLGKRMEAFQVRITAKGGAAPGTTATPLKTDAAARVGSNYYKTFNEAFDAMPDGGSMYVIKNCSATHITTRKSFSIFPEERNVKVTFNESTLIPAGIISTEEGWRGSPTWNFSGNGGYTITFDANGKGSSGVIAAYGATINLKNGSRFTNSAGNGVWNDMGITNVYDGVYIYNNKAHGIATCNTVNLYGGSIYGNSYDGIRSQKVINMSGGNLYNNGECGVHVGDGACIFTLTGGTIHDNVDGVGNIDGNGTIDIKGGSIYSNTRHGISAKGKSLSISGAAVIRNNKGIGVAVHGGEAAVQNGKIYENQNAGIANKGSMKLSGGEIFSNSNAGSGGGIANSGTLSISGGNVHDNSAVNGGGIANSGTLALTGGSITGNSVSGSGGGICLSGGTLRLTGGTIAKNKAKNGNGIYHNGAVFQMGGNGAVDAGNDVYLQTNKYITVTSALKSSPAAVLTPSGYSNGRKAAEVAYGTKKGSLQYARYSLTPKGGYCLRPGDMQASGANTEAADIVLSTKYTIQYHKNYDGEVANVPKSTPKYWYENAGIAGEVPSEGRIKFLGWSENAAAEKPAYKPGDVLSASINRNITLYAVWGTKIQVSYDGNGSDVQKEKSEEITLQECMKNGGYLIHKNKGYTDYIRKGYKFAGWDVSAGAPVQAVKYPDQKENRVKFEELMDIAEAQAKTPLSGEKTVQQVRLYALWDKFPEITAEGIQEFFEGTEVTRDMLLANIKAQDQEDGDITKDIRILGIKYQKGRLRDGQKQEAYEVRWKDGMPEDKKLDTWFLELDDKDSPVEHQIIYSVKDSAGNETVREWPVKVKYNEFPVIEAEDRYFTLEEAKEGRITEEVLLRGAIESGALTVKDKEEDERYPGRMEQAVKLEDFHPEEFTRFEDSGYIVITFSAKDSMGPGGEGKETFRQCTVHIVKDGEITSPEPLKYVRFINREYYEKNLNAQNENTGKETGKPESETASGELQNGGLYLNSKWYRIPEFRALLSGAWDEEKPAREVWTFKNTDVKNIKSYVEEHGIGNSQERTSLLRFHEEFSHLRVL